LQTFPFQNVYQNYDIVENFGRKEKREKPDTLEDLLTFTFQNAYQHYEIVKNFERKGKKNFGRGNILL